MFRKMKRKNTIAILLMLVATAFLVANCERDREPLCDEEPMDSCEAEGSDGTCVVEKVDGMAVAKCVCTAPLHTYGLSCAPRKETCQEGCEENADCTVNNTDIKYVCNKSGACVPGDDFVDKCESDFLCLVELANWTTDCSTDGTLCAANETCIKIGVEDDKILGRCATSDCTDEADYIELTEVCPDPADTDNVLYFGDATECATMTDFTCADGYAAFRDQCGCGCIKGDGMAKACGGEELLDVKCVVTVGCVNPCNVDADCAGGFSKCSSGSCVCATDLECATNVPGTSKCVEGACQCATDTDCSTDKVGDECVGGVCRCSADSVCTADTDFDGNTWECAL